MTQRSDSIFKVILAASSHRVLDHGKPRMKNPSLTLYEDKLFNVTGLWH